MLCSVFITFRMPVIINHFNQQEIHYFFPPKYLNLIKSISCFFIIVKILEKKKYHKDTNNTLNRIPIVL